MTSGSFFAAPHSAVQRSYQDQPGFKGTQRDMKAYGLELKSSQPLLQGAEADMCFDSGAKEAYLGQRAQLRTPDSRGRSCPDTAAGGI